MQEALVHHVVGEGEQPIPVSGDVEQADRFAVKPELRPGEDLEQFLDRAEAARQRDHSIRQRLHQRLALVHRFDDPQVFEAGVSDLPVDQHPRDHADHLAALGEDGVGHGPHHSDLSPAVDEPQALRRKLGAERRASLHICRHPTGAGSAEDEHASHGLSVFADGAERAIAASGNAFECELASIV